jgi:HPt (histidine-containing phosphotransfer) domain-containing protein
MGSDNNPGGMSHALQLLEQLKASFIRELPERCNRLEELTLAFGHQQENREHYEELYRSVHSLKGSGGTHGLPIITQICHQLEDHLNSLSEQGRDIDNDFVDVCLSHIDLIQQTARLATQQNPDFSDIEQELEQIKRYLLQDRFSGLIVDSSSVMALMCQDALSSLPVQLSLVDNGLSALERLLQTRFDFLVTGKELKVLNGVALISALRVPESVNKSIKTVMLTSTYGTNLPIGGKPDYLLTKDSSLPEKLKETVSQLLREVKQI